MKTYTLEEFNDLVHELNVAKWAALGKAHCAIRKDFKLTKRKPIGIKLHIDTMEDGIPRREYVVRESREVVDTNQIQKLYITFAKIIYGIKLERKGSEGKGRFYGGKMHYQKGDDSGRADLMGEYELKYGSVQIGVEVKQRNEKLLPSQERFRDNFTSKGHKYYVVRNFDEFQQAMDNFINFVKTIKQ
jgi:hypothetical protein